jgi:uncharacterized protein YxeA
MLYFLCKSIGINRKERYYMKKNLLGICLVLVIVLGGLTGCGEKKEEGTTTTTVATSSTTTTEEAEGKTSTTTTSTTTKSTNSTKKTKTTTTTKKTEKKSEEPKKNYTCPDGYKLEGTNCTLTKDATATCPDGTKMDGELCVKLTDYNKGERTCPRKSYEGHEYDGLKVEAGTTFCYYAPVDAYKTKEACEAAAPSNPYVWYNGGSKCYKGRTQEYTTTCSGDYKYYTSADILNKFGGHNNGGCHKTSKVTYKCDNGFTLKDKKCIKTEAATLT